MTSIVAASRVGIDRRRHRPQQNPVFHQLPRRSHRRRRRHLPASRWRVVGGDDDDDDDCRDRVRATPKATAD